jgi:hypothetical protein
LHHCPASVLSISGRNQTPGACGTQTRSSSGIAWTTISGGESGCVEAAAAVIALPLRALLTLASGRAAVVR